eukprot:5977899-Alexandrium_andersonii.AAC.1
MSASLVGSEMCIRDSAAGESALTERLASRRPKLLCKSIVAHSAARIWSCLLYTSDAADDM